MNTIDFADIAALFSNATATAPTVHTDRDTRELTALEVAGIGGGEGVSAWG